MTYCGRKYNQPGPMNEVKMETEKVIITNFLKLSFNKWALRLISVIKYCTGSMSK